MAWFRPAIDQYERDQVTHSAGIARFMKRQRLRGKLALLGKDGIRKLAKTAIRLTQPKTSLQNCFARDPFRRAWPRRCTVT